MKKLLLLILLLMPLNIFAFEIKSKHAILYNLNDDTVLYEVKADDKTSIASLTKIMTALVVIENVEDLDAKVVMTSAMYKTLKEENAATAGIKIGEEVTYRDLLYGLLLPSGAEAAQGLAIATSGDINSFVKKMNDKAKELNLQNTHFANPTGLDNKNHYSTARDVSIILKEALKNDTFKRIFTTKSYTTSNGKHNFKATVVIPSVDTSFIKGSKTGFTYDAGLCLASISSHDGVDYLLVTIDAPYNNRTNHIEDARTIYTYYFNNYGERVVLSKDTLITTITLEDKSTLDYYPRINEDIIKYMTINCDFNIEYEGRSNILKTDKIGDKLGEYKVTCGDETLYTEEVLLVSEMLSIHLEVNDASIIYLLLLLILFVLIFIIKKITKEKSKS